ncbi:hypothetical protein CPC08DRAFT_705247 [Agrocybe pediades]|nr:hypothetical protein CPC08DRAFT_705247 [Agrocybe pediades]
MTGEELEKLGLAVVSERKQSDAVEVGSHLATQVAGPVPSPLIKVTMVSSKNRDGFFGTTSTTFDSNSSVGPSAVISVSTNDLALNFKFPAIASKQVDQHPASSSNKLVKSNLKSANSSEDTIQKRVSKHSKTFGKVIGHLSMQPLKKEKDSSAQQKRQTTPFMSKHSQQLLAVPEYSLPPLKASMSPIRMSFIASAGAAGTINAQLCSFSTALPTIPARAALPPPAVLVPAVNVMPPPQLSVTPASNRPQQQLQQQPLLPSQIQANIVNNPARVRPPRSIPPPALSLNGAPGAFLPEKKGHKRYQSSPAVTNFYLKGWDAGEEVPPVPPVPALPPMAGTGTGTATTVTRKPRARSRSVAAGRGLSVPPVPAIPNVVRA